MSQHIAKFTWGAGPNTVTVAGNFNNWSDTASKLAKQPDGSFAGDIAMPWGEKQAFKYVVDGEWKVREDEAKEWDAAGNMNNVYTAPHAPESTTTAPAAAAATTSKPETTTADAPAAPAVPPTSQPDMAPTAKAETTEASTLLASSAPTAASTGSRSAPVLGGPILGGPVFASSSSKPSTTTTTTTESVPAPASKEDTASTTTEAVPPPAPKVLATAAVPIDDAPTVYEPTPVKIEKTAANANIGEAPDGEQHTIQEQVSEYIAPAAAAVGSYLGGAAAAIQRATGVDLTHGDPLTVEEARAKGIDLSAAEKTDGATDTVTPGAPSASAIAALEEKTEQLKLDTNATGHYEGKSAEPTQVSDVPLPNGEAPKKSTADIPVNSVAHDDKPEHTIPAQADAVDNHQTVPIPVITPVTGKDPKKDRSLDAPTSTDTAGTKPISHDPAVDAKDAKKEAELNPGQTGSTDAAALGSLSGDVKPGETVASPDRPAANTVDTPPPPPKDEVKAAHAPSAPATPAKVAAAPTDSAASTPAKSAHQRDSTSGSDIRKRKSSFFSKIKHAFSPKDKEKK